MADHLEPPRFTAKSIREIRLEIGELFEIDPQKRDQPRDLAAITAYVLKHLLFYQSRSLSYSKATKS
jgi:hypothetical protein